jgi:hypothetical protein
MSATQKVLIVLTPRSHMAPTRQPSGSWLEELTIAVPRRARR